MFTSNPSLRSKCLLACNKITHVQFLGEDVTDVTATYGNQERSIQKKSFALCKKDQDQGIIL